MKKKLLSLAVATAALATLVAPVYGAEGDTSTSVTIADGTNFSVAISGDVETAVVALNADATSSASVGGVAADDWIRIADDKLANPGHYVELSLTFDTWTYTGTAAGVDLSLTSNRVTGDDEIYMNYDFDTADHSAVDGNGDACLAVNFEGDVVDAQFSPDFAGDNTDEVARLAGAQGFNCGGTFTYVMEDLRVVGPLNGLAVGTYAITGTVTGTDGQV